MRIPLFLSQIGQLVIFNRFGQRAYPILTLIKKRFVEMSNMLHKIGLHNGIVPAGNSAPHNVEHGVGKMPFGVQLIVGNLNPIGTGNKRKEHFVATSHIGSDIFNN